MFFLNQASFIVAELLGPALGSVMMKNMGVWPPLLVSLICTGTTTILAGTIPETIHLKEELSDQPDDDCLEDSISGTLRYVMQTLKFICRSRIVLILVLSFLVVDFARQSLSILLQYASTRYSIPIAEVSKLIHRLSVTDQNFTR